MQEYPEWLNNFTYNTRTSSREFCHTLINNSWKSSDIDVEHKKISTTWFYNSWKFDPTISGMVATLRTIDDIFKNTSVDKGALYALLFEMQIKNEIICLPGNYYIKTMKDFRQLYEKGRLDDLI